MALPRSPCFSSFFGELRSAVSGKRRGMDTVMSPRAAPACIRRRCVFICGLHRSGTSVAWPERCQTGKLHGFQAGVIEDEAQYLQDVYRTGQAYGGPGKFGFDPRAHLTDFTPANRRERAETAAELGTLLGPKQSYPRGKDAGQSSEDAFPASSVPSQLLHCY